MAAVANSCARASPASVASFAFEADGAMQTVKQVGSSNVQAMPLPVTLGAQLQCSFGVAPSAMIDVIQDSPSAPA